MQPIEPHLPPDLDPPPYRRLNLLQGDFQLTNQYVCPWHHALHHSVEFSPILTSAPLLSETASPQRSKHPVIVAAVKSFSRTICFLACMNSHPLTTSLPPSARMQGLPSFRESQPAKMTRAQDQTVRAMLDNLLLGLGHRPEPTACQLHRPPVLLAHFNRPHKLAIDKLDTGMPLCLVKANSHRTDISPRLSDYSVAGAMAEMEWRPIKEPRRWRLAIQRLRAEILVQAARRVRCMRRPNPVGWSGFTPNPFEYLTTLQKHASRLASDPDSWMPWNYQGMLQSDDAP